MAGFRCGIGRVFSLVTVTISCLLLLLIVSEYYKHDESLPRRAWSTKTSPLWHKKLQNSLPKLPDADIQNVETFLFFVGYPRSGHSILASCLDAHPDVMLAHELNLFGKLIRPEYHDYFIDTNFLFNTLYQNSVQASKTGWRSMNNAFEKKGYSLHFNSSDSWQGKYRDLRVIGDKSGGLTSRVYRDQHDPFVKVFEELLSSLQVPIKVLHVVRNPYDIIATGLLYRFGPEKGLKANVSTQNKIDDRRAILQSIKSFAGLVYAVGEFTKKWKEMVLEVHLADFTSDTENSLHRICDFLGLNCSSSFLQMCDDVIFDKPTKSRHLIAWRESDKVIVNKIIRSFSSLHRYSFESK